MNEELDSIIDKIISDYKEHYDFQSGGESHMRDCLSEGIDFYGPAKSDWGKRLRAAHDAEVLRLREALRTIAALPDFMPAKDIGNLMNLRAAVHTAKKALVESDILGA